MGALSALLFSRVQAASFYHRLHREAVQLLPPGAGRTWLDVGCGPGLVARLAAERGYCATGIDIDPAMVRRATIEARRNVSTASFETASLTQLANRASKADVISAASLLAVIEDRAAAVRLLLQGVARDGTLLLVEPSQRMTAQAAADLRSRSELGSGAWVLGLWARTRVPTRAVGWDSTQVDGYETRCHELLEGLVNAWTIRRSPPAVSKPPPECTANANAHQA